jgi:glucoamylase
LLKHVLTDPHRSVLLVHTKLEILDESLRGKLKLYALLAPHIDRQGANNSGWCSEIGHVKLLHAQREDAPDHGMWQRFLAPLSRLCGRDGWQD